MYVCVHIYIHTHTHVHVHMRIYVCIDIASDLCGDARKSRDALQSPTEAIVRLSDDCPQLDGGCK